MRRLTILVACWKRPELTRLMLEHTQRVAEIVMNTLPDLDEIDVHAIVSPTEDPESLVIVDDLGVAFTSAPNAPLSAKWGAGMAALEGTTGAVMILGSDDFLTAPLLRAAFDAIFFHDVDLYGFSDFFFVGPGPRVARWDGYAPETGRAGEPMGAGRVLSARLLDILKWTPWPADLERGLDGACFAKIQSAQQFFDIKIETVPIVSTGGMLVDVKRGGEDQISAFESYVASGEEVDSAPILAKFPKELVAAWDLDPFPDYVRRHAARAGAPPRLTLAMIAKDSAGPAHRAIRCALPILDEIVMVIDDRSGEEIDAVAGAFHAEGGRRKWSGFAAQRDAAHAVADALGSKWHLILDADETIDLGDLSAAIDRAEAEDADGVAVTLHSHSIRGQVVPMKQVRVVRAGRTKWIFKRHNELVGANKIVPSTAVIRNSYEGRLGGIAAAAIPELEMMYVNPSEPGVTADEEKGHAAVFLARSFMGIDKWNEARIWARLVPTHLPPDHLKCVMAGIVEAWATLFLDGPHAAEAFARDRIVATPGVAEYRYIVGAINMMGCVLDGMNAGRYALIPQGCLAHVPRFPAAFAALGFPFQISFEQSEEAAT